MHGPKMTRPALKGRGWQTTPSNFATSKSPERNDKWEIQICGSLCSSTQIGFMYRTSPTTSRPNSIFLVGKTSHDGRTIRRKVLTHEVCRIRGHHVQGDYQNYFIRCIPNCGPFLKDPHASNGGSPKKSKSPCSNHVAEAPKPTTL